MLYSVDMLFMYMARERDSRYIIKFYAFSPMCINSSFSFSLWFFENLLVPYSNFHKYILFFSSMQLHSLLCFFYVFSIMFFHCSFFPISFSSVLFVVVFILYFIIHESCLFVCLVCLLSMYFAIHIYIYALYAALFL